MNLKLSSLGLVAAGVLLAVFGLCIDLMGIGSPGFGPGQVALILAGLALCGGGLLLRVEAVRRVLTRPAVARALLMLCAIAVALVVAELCLRALESVALGARQGGWWVEDPVLRMRGQPHVAGQDARGWRNPSVLSRADIVVLGDSQTWGSNAQVSETWTSVLGSLSGLRVYNMAMGGYGPVQYMALLDEAMTLKPGTIVAGLYFGNDIWDAYDIVYHVDAHAQFRDPNAPAEFSRPFTAFDSLAPWTQVANQRLPGGFSPLGWLTDGSAAVRLVVRKLSSAQAIAERQWQRARAWALAHPEQGAVYEGGPNRTVLTTAYRLTALDMHDPRIREGLRLTLVMLDRMQSRTKEERVRMVVVLIPTKEAVYEGAMRAANAPLGETYEELLAAEARARQDIMRHCKEHGIECFDSLPALGAAVQKGERLYPQGEDGHFEPRGYAFLAQVVNDALKEPAGTHDRPPDADSHR